MKDLYKCENCNSKTISPIICNDYVDVGDQNLCYQTYYSCPNCNGDLTFIKSIYEENYDYYDEEEDDE